MKNEIVLAIIKKLIDEKFDELSTHVGRRGPKGDSGQDFVFAEHEQTIKEIIYHYVDNLDLKLKFSDLTDEEISYLKGRDGKDFSFDDIKDDVTHIIANVIEATREDLKLKFEDLTDEEKEFLKGEQGPSGRDGRDGQDFIFYDHIDDISNLVRSYVESIKHDLKLKFAELTDEEKESLKLKFSDLTDVDKKSLKLTFDDLTEEEKLSLKGARGQRGKKGDTGLDGLSAYEIWLSFGNTGSVDDFLNSLKVKGDKGEQGLKGDRGFVGPRGLDGKDGKDGEDAPYVIDVEINESGKEFSLIFYFSDGSVLETNSVKMPEIRNTFIAGGGGGEAAGGGGGGGGSGTPGPPGLSAYEVAVENGFVGDETAWLASLVGPQGVPGLDGADGLSAYEVAVNNGFVGTETEWLDSLKATIEYFDEGVSLGTASEVDFVGSGVTATKVGDRVTVSISGGGGGSSTEVLENVPCESDVYVGAAVYFDETILGPLFMSDWPNLSSLISLDLNNSSILAKNALANNWDTSHVVGIVESKASSTLCNIRISGKSENLYFGLDLKKDYYLSSTVPGLIVDGNNAPTLGVLLRIGRPLSQRSLFVSIGERVDRL